MSAGCCETKEIRVVLLGKTGAGKSSLGNTLLGREVFEVGRGLSSGTEVCQNGNAELDDMCLQVTDTPGLCDTHRPEEEVLREVAKSIAIAGPGPHVVLLVFRCDRRFTAEEHEAFCTLKDLFGEDVKKYSIVIFVGTDQLTSKPDERQGVLKEMLKRAPHALQQILSDCSHRCFGVDNRAKSEDRKSQAEELRRMIKSLVEENEGRFFQNNLSKEVHEHVERLIEQKMNKHSITRDQATKATRFAILGEDPDEKGLLDSIMSIVRAVIRTSHIKELCSVM